MRLSILYTAIGNCLTDRCPCSKYIHYCVAFRGKKIIATGSNCVCRLHHRYGSQNSLHAEPACIANIKKEKKSFNILVIRMNESGTRLLISKPCRSCSVWLNLGYFPIKKIYYSTEDGGIMAVTKEDLLNEHSVGKTIFRNREECCKQSNPLTNRDCPINQTSEKITHAEHSTIGRHVYPKFAHEPKDIDDV